MPFPEPKPGPVINYSYLWRSEFEKGPACVVILAVQDVDGEQVVTVAPVTHSPPMTDMSAIEMSAPVKKHLGLDHQKSWIVTLEVNRFVWPGGDRRPIARNKPGQFAFGFIPGDLIREIREQIRERRSIIVTKREI